MKMAPARTIDEHPNFKYYNGHTDKEMHNLNQILLPKRMYKMMREHTGLRSWHHYTAGWSGTQHWSASTSGDNGGGRTALFDQLDLGMSGFLVSRADGQLSSLSSRWKDRMTACAKHGHTNWRSTSRSARRKYW